MGVLVAGVLISCIWHQQADLDDNFVKFRIKKFVGKKNLGETRFPCLSLDPPLAMTVSNNVLICCLQEMYYQETCKTDQFTWAYCKNGLASTGGILVLSLSFSLLYSFCFHWSSSVV